MKHKLFTLLFALMASVGMTNAEVITGAFGDSITWSLNTQDSTLTISGTGEIPSFGEMAPWDRESVGHVVIQEGITAIQEMVFWHHENMRSVQLPQSLIAIYEYAFSSCSSLTSITIPENLKILSQYALYYCSSLTSIVWNAKNYNLADYNTTHGSGKMETRSPFYCVNSYITSFTFGENVETLWPYCCLGMTNLTAITLPEKLDYLPHSSFSQCSTLVSVTIPQTVQSIGNNAFEACISLPSITIPQGVTSIGSEAFRLCSNLASVSIPKSVTTIGSYAFENGEKLKSVYIEDIAAWCAVSFTGDGARANPLCNVADLYVNGELLTDLVLPESVTRINDEAFGNCNSLHSVAIHKNVTYIGNDAFAFCPSLDSVYWNAKNCSLKFVRSSFMGSYTRDNEPFYNSPITTFVCGKDVDTIPAQVCKSLTALSSVVISENVTFIDKMAFYNCDSLKKVVCKAMTPPVCGENVFSLYTKEGPVMTKSALYVPEGTEDAYKAADTWKDFFEIYTFVPESEEGIDQITNDQLPITNKVIHNGQLLILRGDKVYTVTGQEMR